MMMALRVGAGRRAWRPGQAAAARFLSGGDAGPQGGGKGRASRGGGKDGVMATRNPLDPRIKHQESDSIDSEKRMMDLYVDRSNLINIPVIGTRPEVGDSHEDGTFVRKTPWTPVLDELTMRIAARGPITVSEYMQVALAHPIHGYYMRRKEVFGEKGDFVTSPEISSVFGELIGLWWVASWQALGLPDKVCVVEIGPGRGELMKAALHAVRQFPTFCQALKAGGGVRMVETSPALRKVQQANLDCVFADGMAAKDLVGGYGEDAEPIKMDKNAGRERVTLGNQTADLQMRGRDVAHRETEWTIAERMGRLRADAPLGGKSGIDTITVEWFRDFQDVADADKTTPMMVVGQELFDALPVHQFQLTENKTWAERLVDVDPVPESPPLKDGEEPPAKVDQRHHLRFVLARGDTPASKLLRGGDPDLYEVGDSYEVSGVATMLIQAIATRISRTGGGAIVIDYGDNGTGANSLRGIKKHGHVHPLQEPGEVDLSVDVNFRNLAQAVERLNEEIARLPKGDMVPVEVLGPITQGEFLTNMGIHARVSQLLVATDNEEEQERLVMAYNRLVKGDHAEGETVVPGMGQSYKALGLLAKVPGGRDISASEHAGFVPLE